MADIPTREPQQVTAGDTIEWSRSLPDYPASDGWVLSYALRHASANAVNVNAAADGDDHLVTINAATSANIAAGNWSVQGYVTLDGVRRQVYAGWLKVVPNLSAASTYDGRSHARKVLDAIEAVLESRASATLLDSIVEGIQLKRIPHEDLIKMRDKYRAEVASEEDALRLSQGLGSARNIRIRFGGVQ